MVGFLSLFFLMIRFDQVFNLMIFSFLTFVILQDCRVGICPFY